MQHDDEEWRAEPAKRSLSSPACLQKTERELGYDVGYRDGHAAGVHQHTVEASATVAALKQERRVLARALEIAANGYPKSWVPRHLGDTVEAVLEMLMQRAREELAK